MNLNDPQASLEAAKKQAKRSTEILLREVLQKFTAFKLINSVYIN